MTLMISPAPPPVAFEPLLILRRGLTDVSCALELPLLVEPLAIVFVFLMTTEGTRFGPAGVLVVEPTPVGLQPTPTRIPVPVQRISWPARPMTDEPPLVVTSIEVPLLDLNQA
jgi:hypothetical protein